jgi:hypothetical protein
MRYGKILAAALVVGLCFSWFAASAGETCLECRVKGYVKAHMDADLEKALSYLADDFVLQRKDSNLTLDKEAFARVLEWEFATGTRMMYEDLVWEGQTVKAVFREANDFYPLIGVKVRKYEMTFHFEGDRIRELIVKSVKCGCPTLEKKMSAFLEWARANRAAELSRVYADGRFNYGTDSARAWMALLREWHGRG